MYMYMYKYVYVYVYVCINNKCKINSNCRFVIQVKMLDFNKMQQPNLMLKK